MSASTLAPLAPCPLSLSAAELATFQQQGYLACADLLSPAEVSRARVRLDELVAETAADPAAVLNGQVLQRPGQPFHVQFEPSAKPASVRDPELGLKVRKLAWYCAIDPFFGALAGRHPRLHGVLASILGAHPIMFQDMALVKPPFIGSEKPWHQDNAYFAVAPLEQVVGVWIALDDATRANGCMHVLPGGHRRGPLCHYHGRDCEIRPSRLADVTPTAIELPPGGALFFLGMLPHMTPPNQGPLRRRALQLHYRSATSSILDRPAYDRLYCEADGTPASCAANPPGA